MAGVPSDYELALQLHLEMNDNQAPVLQDLRGEMSAAAAVEPWFNSSDIIDLSDSIGESSVAVSNRARSRSPLHKVKTEVEVENQEAITVRENLML